ncbi:MAG: acyltransferase [Bacteroidales bacterium]|jgi:acetyltransferase-like isoleucine patch superfamily enzyme|nr:acyltransferase [Bacteroidales bacterium]
MLNNIIIRINSVLSIGYTFFIKKNFYSFGKSKVYLNTQITNPKAISIKDNTVIRGGAWLLAISNEKSEFPVIEIGSNVYFGRNLHLTALKNVIIEDNVLIADKVYISDNNHGFQEIFIPIKSQPITYKGKVVISAGAWIGENACIIGCCIGKNSIVGANSVVLKDVPDYSIAAGNPAKIIKRYNFETKQWVKTKPNGEFLNE